MARRVFYLERLGEVPTYLCLLFILVRFAVVLYFEVRKKWFPSASAGRVSGIVISVAGVFPATAHPFIA